MLSDGMIYTVTEVATGKVVGASCDSWTAAVDEAYELDRITFEAFDALITSDCQHADGFALHGYKLGVRE